MVADIFDMMSYMQALNSKAVQFRVRSFHDVLIMVNSMPIFIFWTRLV